MTVSPTTLRAASDRVRRAIVRLHCADAVVSRRIAVDWPHPRWLRHSLGAFSLTANYGILWYAVALLPFALGASRPLAKALYLAVPVTLVEVTGFAIKRSVRRQRPPVADPTCPVQIPLPGSHSFPSSHASMAVVATFALAAMLPAATPALIVVAAVLCASRVYLGVHYLGDVAGGVVYGLIFGAGWVLIVAAPR